MLTWEVELGGRVEPQAAPGGQQRPDHLGAGAAAGPGRHAGAVAVLGGRRRGRGPPERHVAQPPTLAPFGVLFGPLLFWRQKKPVAAVYLGRRGADGRRRSDCFLV